MVKSGLSLRQAGELSAEGILDVCSNFTTQCAGQWEISFCFAEKLPGFGLLWSLGSLSAFIAFGHKRAGGGEPLESLLSED